MLHPIRALDHVIASYRDYLTTEFRARDPGLRRALAEALEREGFLAQHPFFSAHQPFKMGQEWADLPLDAKLAAALRKRGGGNPAYLHQSDTIKHLLNDESGPLVISTGTGSGKTEAFLAPALQAALDDAVQTNGKPGLVAIILYPMNALANDQDDRIKWYLQESGWGGAIRVSQYNRGTSNAERVELRRNPPHILLTNYQMLEYLLVRPADRDDLFLNHRLRFMVLDEVHTYGGTLGAHVALLIRRLQAHLRQANPSQPAPRFVGASATIATDAEGDAGEDAAEQRDLAIQSFFGKLAGIEPETIRVVSEALADINIPPDAQYAPAPYAPHPDTLNLDNPAVLRKSLANLAGVAEDTPLLEAARRCRLLWDLNYWLSIGARSFPELVNLAQEGNPGRAEWDRDIVQREVELALRIGAALASIEQGEQGSKISGALRLRAHRFVRGGWAFHRCLNPECGALYPRGESHCVQCGTATAPLYLCRNCGADFWRMQGGEEGFGELRPFPEGADNADDESEEWVLFQRQTWKDTGLDDEDADPDALEIGEGGSLYEVQDGKRRQVIEESGYWDPKSLTFSGAEGTGQAASLYNSRRKCPNCGGTQGRRLIISKVSLGTSAAVKVLTEGLVEAIPGDKPDDAAEQGKKRILIFADSRQDAAHQARFIEYAARYDRMRSRVTLILQNEGPQSIEATVERMGAMGREKGDNPHLYKGFRGFQIPKGKEDRARYYAWEEAPLLDHLAVNTNYRATLENLGLLALDYEGLADFVAGYAAELSPALGIADPQDFGYVLGQILDSLRRTGAFSRPLLQYHPRGNNKKQMLEGARWERRISHPVGLPIAENDAPALRFEDDPPAGVKLRNLWSFKGRKTNVQVLLHHFSRRLNGSEASADGFLELLYALADEQFIKIVELYGYTGRPVRAYQINAAQVALSFDTEATRFRCDTCSRVAHLPLWAQGNTKPCPHCNEGNLIVFKDKTVRKSRFAEMALNPDSIPLKAEEHTAQVPGSRRKEIEADFKSTEKALNVLACSPTLELGIHIGGLEAVALRNVPPRPDNYAQRGGRAGRDERVGLVVGYTRNTPHDQYFFQHPAEMIAGAVPTPAFSLGNRDAIARHVHAIAFGLAQPGVAGRMQAYISFKGDVREDALAELLAGLQEVKNAALAIALDAFAGQTLSEAGYSRDDLATLLDNLPALVEDAVQRTARQVASLHTTVESWSAKGGKDWYARRAGKMINHLLGIPDSSQKEGQGDVGPAYPLRRLAEAGILPGYEFPVEPATLRLLGDRDEWSTLSTARASGLRQFQPNAPVYARGKRWKVFGVDKSSPWNPQDEEPTLYYQRCGRCELMFDPQQSPLCPRCNHAEPGFTRAGVHYAGFIARPDDSPVSDEEDRIYSRNYVEIHPGWDTGAAQNIAGRWRLPDDWRLEWRRGEQVIWLNEGPPDKEGFKAGYRLCPECGWLTNPPPKKRGKGKGRKAPAKSTRQDPYGHAQTCSRRGEEVSGLALYAEAKVETLRLLFPWFGDPANPDDRAGLDRWGLTLGYALLAGAERHFALSDRDLTMLWEGVRQQEFEGLKYWQGVITFIDPNIGGSGYLEKMAQEIERVAVAALHHLDHDDCETACYRCLKTYVNQRYHHLLNWPLVIGTLTGLSQAPVKRLSLSKADIADPRPWLEAAKAGVGSPLEHRWLQILADAGLEPVKQHPISDKSERVFTIADFAFPERRVAIYVDGLAYHLGDRQRRDKAIEEGLRQQDPPWRTIRLTAKDLARQKEVVAQLRAMLGLDRPAAASATQAVTRQVLVDIPAGRCTQRELLSALNTSGALAKETWDTATIRIPEKAFLYPDGVAFLCAWGMRQQQLGKKLDFIGNQDILNYLSRLDLFRHLDYPYAESFQRHLSAGRFIPLKLVDGGDAVLDASNAICDLVLRNFDNGRAFLPALEWAVYEMIDNIALHAQSPTPGVVCAQVYPTSQKLRIAIVDMGQGIKASLSQAFALDSHAAAIEKALQRGVTRSQAIGQGNGLAGALEIARKNGGGFYLGSGDALYSAANQNQPFRAVPAMPGTSVAFWLDTRNPVDLGQTFIESRDWSFIDYESEQIQKSGGLRIAKECLNTGSRAAALPLRRKILALLPDYEGALILDFEGVSSASSSFLDELLGRLAAELGEATFRQRVKLVNIAPRLVAMANVVIAQRLGRGLDD